MHLMVTSWIAAGPIQLGLISHDTQYVSGQMPIRLASD
jgi:hypothetical protein